MKKGPPRPSRVAENDMRAEYDFSKLAGGVRGKFYKAYRTGQTVRILKTDGTTVIHRLIPKEGTVTLEPDVRKYFPDSKAVNKALRCLIPLLAKRHGMRKGGLRLARRPHSRRYGRGEA